jgi:multidrug efflux system outer membrane protein
MSGKPMRPLRPVCAALLAATLAAMLAGCAVGPDYRRPDLALPASFGDAAAASLTSPAIERGWWKLFQDPALDRLIDKALVDNANLQVAVARIEQADAVLREAGSVLFPEVDLGANASRSRISGVSGTPLPAGTPLLRSNFQTALSTAFELDFWGKLRRASEAARAQALATRNARDTVALTLVSQITNAWLNLRALDAQLAVSRETLALREENLRIVRSRSARGLVSDLDLQQALGAGASVRAQIAELQRQRELAEHQLGILAGDLELRIPQGDLRALPAPPLPPAGLPSALLDARPDVRQAEAQLAAANAQIGVVKAQLFPSISLTGNLGSQSKELANLFSGPASIWSFGLTLDFPLFDAGKRAARVDQATAQQKQALAAYLQTVRTAFGEVRDALTATDQYARATQAQKEQMEAATRTLALAQKRYESGYSPYLEVLDAQRSANDSTLAYLRNRQAQLGAAVGLYAALGGGWTQPDAKRDLAAGAPGQ